MNRRALGRAAAAAPLLFALGLAGCTRSAPIAESAGERWQRMHAALDSLGERGREAAALERIASQPPEASVPAWLAADLAATERAWRRRAAMPESVRAELQAADHARARAAAMMAHDSLAAAAAMVRHAASVSATRLGADAPATLRALVTWGEIAFRMSRSGEVDSLADEVMRRLPEASRASHPLAADAQELRGRVLKNFAGVPERDSVLALYGRALAIRERAFGPHSLEAAAVHHELGNMERMARHLPEAQAHFARALAIRRDRLGLRHEQVASTLSALAYLAAADGDWRATERSMRASIDATPSPATMPPATSALRHGLLGQALRRLGRSAEAIAPLTRAAAAAETTWARSDRDASSSVQSGLSIHRELALALAAEGRGEAAFEALERSMSRSWAAGLPGDPWHGLLARVQRTLPDDAALVSWPRTTLSPRGGDYPMWACVVRSRGPVQWVRLERGRQAGIGDPPREALLLEILRAAQWPLRILDTRVVDSLAMDMGRERFAPLEPHLAGARRIIVFGPAMLEGAPLALLRDARGQWLDAGRTIHYVPSALAYVALATRPRVPTQGAWLVGAPTVGAADSTRWAPLAGAAGELRALAGLFPHATVLTGADASAARLREAEAHGALRHASVLHLATHTDMQHQRAMQSAFVLAPDAGSGAHSSRLTAGEVARHWRLDARLVSLASCQSALGMTSATDGYLGLQSALLEAGARSVLVSVWRVDDAATAQLMHAFYEALLSGELGMDAAGALRHAQRSVRTWRDAQGRTPYAHPVYWAGFALVGTGE